MNVADELSAGTITLRQATARIAAEASLLPFRLTMRGAPPSVIAEAREFSRKTRLLELDVERAYVEHDL